MKSKNINDKNIRTQFILYYIEFTYSFIIFTFNFRRHLFNDVCATMLTPYKKIT